MFERASVITGEARHDVVTSDMRPLRSTMALAAGLFMIGTLSGCEMLFPLPESKLPTVEEHADGTRTVAIENLGIQVRGPKGLDRYGSDEGSVSLFWGASRAYVGIDTKDPSPDVESKINELRTASRGFSVGESQTFDNGWDVYYSFANSKFEKRIGYYSQVTVDDKTYRCFIEDGVNNIDAMRTAQKLCRSAEKLAPPSAKSNAGG